MTALEFQKKYKPYAYSNRPFISGKEIKEDVLSLDKETGYSSMGSMFMETPDGCADFTRESIDQFIAEYVNGKYPLSDKKYYQLEFVGGHCDILIAKKE